MTLFSVCLEDMRRRFALCVYGYVVMPEHVHLLLSEPEQGTLADAVHYLKLSFTKRLHSQRPGTGSFGKGAITDRNVRNADEFTVKLRYLHRNPVKRGLVPRTQATGAGAASGTMLSVRTWATRSASAVSRA